MISTQPLRDSTSLVGDVAALRRIAEDDGYLFCRDLVPLRDVLAVRDLALEVADAKGWLQAGVRAAAGMAAPGFAMGAYDDPRWIEFLQRVLVDPSFRALGVTPQVLDVLGALLGGPPETHPGDILRVVTGDDPAHTTKPHQGAFYIRTPLSLWTAWMPLGSCPLSLGPIALLRGSQKGGLRPHAGEGLGQQGIDVPPDVTWWASDLDAGDVVFFSALTIHRALPHRLGKRLRLSADYRYAARLR